MILDSFLQDKKQDGEFLTRPKLMRDSYTIFLTDADNIINGYIQGVVDKKKIFMTSGYSGFNLEMNIFTK